MRRSCTVAGLVLAAAALPAAAVAASPPVVRTGGPSLPGDRKIAVVASSSPLAGRAFTVVDRRGRVVLRGRLRAAQGSAAPWRHAATANLSKVSAPGRFRVRAAGLTSRSWVVDGGGAQRALVQRLLRIFAVNADGDEANPVFGAAHRNDAIAASGPSAGKRVDLTGGWRDAGDMLKFAQTTAYAVIGLELAARLAPQDAATLRATSDVGLRWLLKAHPADGAFYVLVGDERDHGTDFRDPAGDDGDPRQGVGVRYAYPSESANVLAEVGAALALAAANRSSGAHDVLLAAARKWIDAARRSGRIVRIGSPFVEDFYPDDDVSDDLALAATALYRATGDPADAAAASAALGGGDDDQFYSGVTPGTVGPIAAAEMCGVLGAPALPDAAQQAGCSGLTKTLDAARGRMRDTAFGTPGIVTFGWVQDNAGVGALAAAAARAGFGGSVAREVGAAARDYLFGRNPWGRSFVVGPGRQEARNPHHPAYLRGRPATLLDGAVVGGVARPSDLKGSGLPPARGALHRFDSSKVVYEDRRADFVTSEVGLSYSTGAVLLMAALSGA